MPQAEEWLRNKWGIMDGPAIEFLESRGFKLTREWCWTHPCPEHYQPTDEEYEAVIFLIDEWDFGPICLTSPAWVDINLIDWMKD